MAQISLLETAQGVLKRPDEEEMYEFLEKIADHENASYEARVAAVDWQEWLDAGNKQKVIDHARRIVGGKKGPGQDWSVSGKLRELQDRLPSNPFDAHRFNWRK